MTPWRVARRTPQITTLEDSLRVYSTCVFLWCPQVILKGRPHSSEGVTSSVSSKENILFIVLFIKNTIYILFFLYDFASWN
jgi:hypothetical protein